VSADDVLDTNDTLDSFVASAFSLPRDCGGASPSRLSPLEPDYRDIMAEDGGGWRRVGKR
jgi:hypothetical protein